MAVFRIFALAISVNLLLPTTAAHALGWDDVAGCAVLACVPTIVKGALDDTADHLSGDAPTVHNANKTPSRSAHCTQLASASSANVGPNKFFGECLKRSQAAGLF